MSREELADKFGVSLEFFNSIVNDEDKEKMESLSAEEGKAIMELAKNFVEMKKSAEGVIELAKELI